MQYPFYTYKPISIVIYFRSPISIIIYFPLLISITLIFVYKFIHIWLISLLKSIKIFKSYNNIQIYLTVDTAYIKCCGYQYLCLHRACIEIFTKFIYWGCIKFWNKSWKVLYLNNVFFTLHMLFLYMLFL